MTKNYSHMSGFCRPERLELIRNQSVIGNPCILCFDADAGVVLRPCGHEGFCADCAQQLDTCPMCRASIEHKDQLSNVVVEI